MTMLNVDDLSPEQSRRRLELVIEGTHLGMWDWNPQTNEVAFNDIWAEMLGYDLSEISPSLDEWQSRVHPDDLAGCYRDIQAHMDGETALYHNVHRMKHRAGHWVYILDRGKVVERDEQGRPIRFTGTHTDISEQKRAEVEARSLAAAKSEFLATMSHEIRTPLNGLIGLTQLLRESGVNAQQTAYVEVMAECGAGLLAVINDILDFSKIDAGQLVIDPQPTDLVRVMRMVHALFQGQAAAKGLAYHLVVPDPQPAAVMVDDHRLKQVVMNLLTNALKFTSTGTVELALAVSAPADDRCHVQVRVTDSGKGINDSATIWDRFTQEDGSISRHHGGTGLGLAISRRLVELMGGTITVESVPGHGATFIVELEVAMAGAVAAPIVDTASLPLKLAQQRVLVVDDDRVNRLVAEHTLSGLGAEVLVVDGGAAAVAACAQQRFDVIFLDLHMPGMNGLEVAAKIRHQADGASPVIYALTADVISDHRERCQAAGIAGVIGKPFTAGDLLRALVAAAPGASSSS
ncbi:MAG: ATP-binding protein [Planctomycetota bacterium]